MIFSGYMSCSGIVGLYCSSIPSFLRNLILWLYQFIFPPTVQEGFFLSTSSPTFIVCRFVNDGHSDWCEVTPHCFDLHLFNNEWCCRSIHVFVGYLSVFLEKWQLTPVFLPGKSHGQRSLESRDNGVTRVGHDLATKLPLPPPCFLWRNVCFCPFFDWVVFLVLSFMSCLYILDINPLSIVSFAITFSHFEGCLLILFIVFLRCAKAFKLN